MNSFQTSTFDWNYWANIIYINGMIGYIIIDLISYVYLSLNNTISFVIYLFLAMIFVIDTWFYTIDWYICTKNFRKSLTQPIENRFECSACLFLHFGSYFYLLNAILNFNKTQMIKSILFMNLLGILSFLFESFLTFFSWILINRRNFILFIQNIYFWTHFLNIIANIIYLSSNMLAYYYYYYEIYSLSNPNIVLLIQIIGDFVYLFDAYLYNKCWQRNQEKLNKYIEQNVIYFENK